MPDMPQPTPAPAQGASPADQGNVMISMPREALEGLRQMVGQLAMGLEQLTKAADAKGQGEPAPQAQGMPGEEKAPSDGGEDQAFLADMAREGSQRGGAMK